MLSKGADPNAKTWYGDSPLLHSLSEFDQIEIFKLLVGKIGDVKRLLPDGTTLLQLAVSRNNAAAFKYLLQKGASIEQKSSTGDTAIHTAVRTGNKATVQMLLDFGAKLDVRNLRGDLPIHISMRSGYTYSNSGAFASGYYSSSYITSKGNAEITLLLVDHHSPIALRDQFGMAPLAYAILNHDRLEYGVLEKSPKDRVLAVFAAASQNDVPTLSKLIASNPLLATERISNGASPIHVAALWGAQDAVAFLIKHGADINSRDGGGSTPLHYASRSNDGAPMISYLLSKGANIGAWNARDETPLHVAVLARSIENTQILLAKKADVHAQGENSGAPLSVVDPNGGEAIARLLFDAGADAHEANKHGDQPLIIRAVYSQNAALITLLAKHGADLNAVDENSDYTPLMRAAMSNSMTIAQTLIDLGADPGIVTSNGESALGIAARGNNKEMVALFQKKP